MLLTVVIIILTFFAVIGAAECVITLMETLSACRCRTDDFALSVTLSGKVDNVLFLLNSLLIQAQRISFGGTAARVVVIDGGMDEETFMQVHTFCGKNDNITVEL